MNSAKLITALAVAIILVICRLAMPVSAVAESGGGGIFGTSGDTSGSSACLIDSLNTMFSSGAAKLPSASGDDYIQLIGEADKIWDQRGDMEKAKLAAAYLSRAVELKPDDVELVGRQVRLLIWIGVQEPEGEELVWYEEAARIAERCLKANPKDYRANYHLGLAHGLRAAVVNPLHALCLVPVIKEELNKVIAADPAYHHAGAYRVLGRVYMLTPEAMGGDLKLAEEYFKKAIELGPDYKVNQLYMADLLEKQGRYDQGRKYLVEVAEATPTPGMEPEFAYWKKLAKDILDDRLAKKGSDLSDG